MSAPRLHILVSLLLLAYCLPWARAEELPPLASEADEANQIDTQLRINKTTLLENKNDKNRIDAATLLLFSENPAAREILLDVLRRTDNPGARAAVCEALNPRRVWQRPLRNKEDFIKPLINIIITEPDFTIAKLAAEATLIFGYSQVQQELERAAADPSVSVNAKVNIIYALKRHPDKQAVAKLIALLDSPEPPVAEAARSALASIGLVVSSDPGARRQMLAELQQRGTEAFLRERLIRQETRMRELETDLDTWQTRYLKALDSLYNSIPAADDAAKSAFLAQQLSAPETRVRLWSLDKLEELRRGTSKLKLSEQLQAVLLGLISDPNRQVRSKMARLLTLMGELNAAKPLLDQLKIEQDDQVRRELFTALGGACYFASLPTAGHKVADEVRKETLEWAVKFLDDADADKARSGADVIGKLLEQDGLKPEEVENYLKALSNRYIQAGGGTDQGLRGYMLGAMASLCATRSTCRMQAAKMYGVLFEQALSDPVEVVRQTAVDGLVNIDNTAALRRLRKDMLADPSVAVRKKVIDVAGEAGGAQDLEWLVEKLGLPGEGDAAWQAMLKIFRRANAAVLADWMAQMDGPALTSKVLPEQKISFLTLVEQKGQSESNTDLVRGAQKGLVQLYIAGNNLKQAAEYLKTLVNAATSEQEKRRLRSQLLGVYLASSSIEQACEIIGNFLEDKNLDLSTDGMVVKPVEEYLENLTNADPETLLEALRQIKVSNPDVARAWRALVSRWAERFARARKAEDLERVSN
jgi:HEAT repeat protein